MTYILDTCILIDFLRGEESVYDLLVHNDVELTMSTVTFMELVIGAFNKREVNYIQKAFKNIGIMYIDEEISELAEKLVIEFSKSHNLHIDDALIAATSIMKNYELVTYNVSDFKFIPGIKLFQFEKK
ncbi:MAG: type II toxin-antitoxin system VapC family toxin [Treponema sp.]|nr:type II toxin-antitoxin system VapC family toxin [Treponema sp.]